MRLELFTLVQLVLLRTSSKTINLSDPAHTLAPLTSRHGGLSLSSRQLDFLARSNHQLLYSTGCHSTGKHQDVKRRA